MKIKTKIGEKEIELDTTKDTIVYDDRVAHKRRTGVTRTGGVNLMMHMEGEKKIFYKHHFDDAMYGAAERVVPVDKSEAVRLVDANMDVFHLPEDIARLKELGLLSVEAEAKVQKTKKPAAEK